MHLGDLRGEILRENIFLWYIYDDIMLIIFGSSWYMFTCIFQSLGFDSDMYIDCLRYEDMFGHVLRPKVWFGWYLSVGTMLVMSKVSWLFTHPSYINIQHDSIFCVLVVIFLGVRRLFIVSFSVFIDILTFVNHLWTCLDNYIWYSFSFWVLWSTWLSPLLPYLVDY